MWYISNGFLQLKDIILYLVTVILVLMFYNFFFVIVYSSLRWRNKTVSGDDSNSKTQEANTRPSG